MEVLFFIKILYTLFFDVIPPYSRVASCSGVADKHINGLYSFLYVHFYLATVWWFFIICDDILFCLLDFVVVFGFFMFLSQKRTLS